VPNKQEQIALTAVARPWLFLRLLMRASAANLQVVLLAADPISGARIVNDISVIYPSPDRRWYFSPTLKTGSFVANAFPEKIEGAVGVAPSIFASADAFAAEFTATWNGDVPLDGAFYYYDALTLVALSIERAWTVAGKQDPTFEDLRDSVRAVAEPSRFSATRKGWSERSESCDEFMKFGMSSSGCESRPAKG
jgi:hypothetical protein